MIDEKTTKTDTVYIYEAHKHTYKSLLSSSSREELQLIIIRTIQERETKAN